MSQLIKLIICIHLADILIDHQLGNLLWLLIIKSTIFLHLQILKFQVSQTIVNLWKHLKLVLIILPDHLRFLFSDYAR